MPKRPSCNIPAFWWEYTMFPIYGLFTQPYKVLPIFLIQVGDFLRLPNDTLTDVWFWCINMFTFYICKYICKYINLHHASLTNFEFNLIPSGSMYSRRRWSAYASTWSQPTPINTMGEQLILIIDLLYHKLMMKSCRCCGVSVHFTFFRAK